MTYLTGNKGTHNRSKAKTSLSVDTMFGVMVFNVWDTDADGHKKLTHSFYANDEFTKAVADATAKLASWKEGA